MHPVTIEADRLFEYTRKLRRDFHRYPEIGFQEVRTAGIVARELKALNLEVSTGIAETGVVALIEGSRSGPVILLRFDMDALPVREQSNADYASQNPGVMHACGHDGHTAIGLTVARILHSHRQELAGTVKLVFQPAEEGLGGAERMLAEGLLENPKPDLALALHLWNEKPAGWLGITSGPVMAASETFSIWVTGRGGHGAVPYRAVDPVLASAQIVCALQSIVSRNVPPLKSAVISVTTIHGGDVFNVIPSQVEMRGTIRTFEPEVRHMLLERFQDVVQGVAQAFGCQAKCEVRSITPALVNDPKITAQVQDIAKKILPGLEVDLNDRSMGSEDMAYIMQEVPGCYFFVGSANAEKGLNAAHHNPRFDFHEQVMGDAAALMAAAAMHFLK